MQGAAAVMVRTLNISTKIDQRLNHAVVAIKCSKVQRPPSIAIHRTHVCTDNRDKRSDRVVMPVARRIHQRRGTVRAARIHVRTHLYHLQRGLRVAVPAGTMQSSTSILGARVDVGTISRQRHYTQGVPVHSCVMDCKPAIHVCTRS